MIDVNFSKVTRPPIIVKDLSKTSLQLLVHVWIVLSFFILLPANGQDSPSLLLKGNVNFAKPIKPVDPLLWPGNEFNEDAATSLLKGDSEIPDIWRKIPSWEAGAWESTQAVNFRVVRYQNGQTLAGKPTGVYKYKTDIMLGWQKDINREIWDWCQTNRWTITDHDKTTSHSYIIKANLPEASEDFDQHYETIEFVVDKATGKITDTHRRHSWVKYIYIAPGLMKEETVHTAYELDGTPDSSSWNSTLLKRTCPFDSVEIYSNSANYKEAKLSFISFLTKNELANLLPPVPSRKSTPTVQHNQKANAPNYNTGGFHLTGAALKYSPNALKKSSHQSK